MEMHVLSLTANRTSNRDANDRGLLIFKIRTVSASEGKKTFIVEKNNFYENRIVPQQIG